MVHLVRLHHSRHPASLTRVLRVCCSDNGELLSLRAAQVLRAPELSEALLTEQHLTLCVIHEHHLNVVRFRSKRHGELNDSDHTELRVVDANQVVTGVRLVHLRAQQSRCFQVGDVNWRCAVQLTHQHCRCPCRVRLHHELEVHLPMWSSQFDIVAGGCSQHSVDTRWTLPRVVPRLQTVETNRAREPATLHAVRSTTVATALRCVSAVVVVVGCCGLSSRWMGSAASRRMLLLGRVGAAS